LSEIVSLYKPDPKNLNTGHFAYTFFNNSLLETVNVKLAHSLTNNIESLNGNLELNETIGIDNPTKYTINVAPNSYRSLIFQLSDYRMEFDNNAINDILNVIEIKLTPFKLKDEFYKNLLFIKDFLAKQDLNKECFYYEYNNDQTSYLIFENKSKVNTYNFKLNFINIVQLSFLTPLPEVISVLPGTFEYLKLLKNTENGSHQFQFSYSYSKIN
jgi:hypothetical protein